MIGKIIIGKSFRGCLSYCLDKDRAEVIQQHLCFGEKKELIQQFNEVRQLNERVSKPVLHITLSLVPGERLSGKQQQQLLDAAANDLGYEKNQWIGIAHHDTSHQHFHIVVNRIGFDGKTLSDSNNYKRIANFCRRMERELGLQEVQSPRRFLSAAERNTPRFDQRKEKLRQIIIQALKKARDYPDFEKKVKASGYEVIRARGIRFIDDRKVKIKGSEVGFALQKIEKILSMDQLLRTVLLNRVEEKRKEAGITAGAAGRKMEWGQGKDHSKEMNKSKDMEVVQQAAKILTDPRVQLQNLNNSDFLKRKKRKKRLGPL